MAKIFLSIIFLSMTIALMLAMLCGQAAGVLAAENVAADRSIANQVDEAINHAETYYWLDIAEQGNPADSTAGLRHLSRARQLAAHGLPAVDADRGAARIAVLEADLEEQAAAAGDTLEGVFPLAPMLTSSPIIASGPGATYQLIRDPAIKAATDAATDLQTRAMEWQKDRRLVQLPVLFISVPQNQLLEDWVLRIFRASPRFRVYTHAEAAAALTPAELADLLAGRITPAVKTGLLKGFGAAKLLTVTIRPVDATEGIYRYETEGHLLDAASNSPPEQFSTMGLSRDCRDRLAWMVLANVVLLVLAVAAYASLVHTHRALAVDTSWSTLLLAPLAGFAVGRILPCVIAPLLGSLRVGPTTPLAASFWFPLAAGLGLVGVPLAVYWMASPQLAKLRPILSLDTRGGAMFAAIGAGIAAYLAGPLLLYLEGHLLVDVTLTTVSVMLLAYLAGRALDNADPLPMATAVVPLLLTMLLGAAVLHVDTTWLGLATALIVVTGAVIVAWDWVSGRRRHAALRRDSSQALAGQTGAGGVPADAQELAQRTEDPAYQPFSAFDRAWDRVRGFLDGRGCHLALFGPRGAGKTAAAEELANRLVRDFETRGSRPTLLCGCCPQAVGEPMAYAPFRQALAQHFEVNLLTPPGPKIQQISQALGGLFGSVIPFAGILFPRSGGGDSAVRPDEINASIAWMLRRLSKTGPILLLLDDVQWLDDASAALVKHLLRQFPAGGPVPLLVLLVANDKSCFARLGFDLAQHGIEVAYLSVAEQAQILVRGVGLLPGVAEEVLARIGPARETDGGLLWPLQVVGNLARSGALTRTAEGFGWAGGAWPVDVKIPGHMQAAIHAQWEDAAQYRTVLECAACGCQGREFRASVVADALGKPLLDLLVVLDEIERTTGIIHDVRDRDDVYAFHSTFLLEVIRGHLGVLGHGPGKSDVPQIVREYHARLGVVLENAIATPAGNLFEVANHFYAAGPRHAAKGVEYCLRAARSAAAAYEFLRAEKYLDMAGECAQCAGAGPAVEIERQIILCQEAQVTSLGRERNQVAAAGLEYLTAHPGAPARLALTLAELCYAIGRGSNDRKWQEEAIRLSGQVAAHAGSPHEEAQARHIMAVSQPLERRAERIAELRRACGLLEGSKTEDRDASRSLARIMNSLAEELGKGPAEDWPEAKRLFEYRLQLDQERQLGDLRGVAITLAGLGRLEWFNEPKDIPSAEKHFQRDLEISEAIGDVVGQVKMHSFLGGCALEKDDLKQAVAHYGRSLELSDAPIDQYFASVGLLRCYQREGRSDALEATAKRLLELVERDGLSFDGDDELRAVLESLPTVSRSDAVQRLLSAIRHKNI